MIGQYVLSCAGRDKGRVMVVIEIIDDQYVLVADGKSRRLENLKRKKLKHLKMLDGKAELPCTNKKLYEQIQQMFNLS